VIISNKKLDVKILEKGFSCWKEDICMKKKLNPFSKDNKDNEKDSFWDSLFKDTKKYDKSTYPNTYVWIEKFHESKNNERKSNIIKAKKKG
jgi:hypothetical protein